MRSINYINSDKRDSFMRYNVDITASIRYLENWCTLIKTYDRKFYRKAIIVDLYRSYHIFIIQY